jgi:hypothetical protein
MSLEVDCPTAAEYPEKSETLRVVTLDVPELTVNW